MTQPNLQIISESLKALAVELPNLPNFPILSVMERLEKTAKLVEETSKRNNETTEQVRLFMGNFSLAFSTRMYIIFWSPV